MMKVRKNLSPDARAVVAGQRIADEHEGGNLSLLVEKQLLALTQERATEHFSPHTGKPVQRREVRFVYLKRKHA
jgi:hypothetical protein